MRGVEGASGRVFHIRDDGQVVGIHHIAVLVGRYQHTLDGLRPSNGTQHGIEQSILRVTLVHLLQAVLDNDRLGTSRQSPSLSHSV